MSKKTIIIIVLTLVVIVGIIIVLSRNKPAKLSNNTNSPTNNPIKNQNVQQEFRGEKGETLVLSDAQVQIDAEILNDNLAHHYNTELPSGKIVYFFVVKDKNGIYRAAANACQVCFQDKMGFQQQGDFMVCSACKNKYPLEKIATEKGGCNPGPINPDIKVQGGKIIIKQSELEQVENFF